jgi:hypothetical protein
LTEQRRLDNTVIREYNASPLSVKDEEETNNITP